MSKRLSVWHWSYIDQYGNRREMESQTYASDAEFKRQTKNECQRNGWKLEKMKKIS